MKNLLHTSFLILTFSLNAQLDSNQVVHFSDSMMRYGTSVPMIPGGILSIVSSDTIYHQSGYGYGNYQDKLPIDPEQTLFQLGSVGKVMTAISVLQQVENEGLELQRNVNDYLEGWSIANPYSRDLTLSHLLTHTAGLNDHVIGYLARNVKELTSLEVHLKKNMPSFFQPPGVNINYSNYSYALAGHLVEIASEKSFSDYVQSNILDRIGMSKSTYVLPDNYQERVEYARGYRWRETFEEIRSYPRHAIPAGSINATGADMATFMQALLARDSSLLSTVSFDYLLEQQFANDDHLTGYSLGMEIQDFNGHFAVAKGGQIPGFLSILILFPKNDLGIFLSLNTETDNFLELFFREFKRRFFSTPGNAGERLEADISEYIGHYGSLRTNHETIEELFMLYDGHFEFTRSSRGNLTAFHNGEWQEYLMTERDVFRNEDDPNQFAIFKRDTSGEISHLYRNVQVGGIQIPASYRRLGWFERPRFMNDEYPILLLIVPSYLLLVLGWIFIFFIRKKKPELLLKSKIPALYHAMALLFLLLFFWNIIGFFLPLLRDRADLFFDFDQSLLSMRYYNWTMAITAIGLVVLTFILWFRNEGNWAIRLYYSLYSLVALSYVLILHRWHFLHITYQ